MPDLKVEDARSSVPKQCEFDPECPFDPESHHGSSYNLYEPFKPILDRVLIRRVEDEQKTKLGLPDKFRQQTNKGEVVAIGDLVILGNHYFPLRNFVDVGDRVLFGEYNAEKFVRDGEELYIVRIQDIRGVEHKLAAPGDHGEFRDGKAWACTNKDYHRQGEECQYE